MVEWLNNILKSEKFSDQLHYFVDRKVIDFTEDILLGYRKRKPSHEGLVYWCGKRDGKKVYVNSVIAPKTISSPGRVSTTYESNAKFVRLLSKNKIVQIAQVHSHPSTWVGHSDGDNKFAAFKVKGLLSIVVPSYGKDGMLPFQECGMHLFTGKKFIKLSNQYVKKRFKIIEKSYQLLADLRNE